MTVTERFLAYVKIHTTSDEHSGTHPSFSGERVLAGLLCDQLSAFGLKQVRLTDDCYVYGLLPATKGMEDRVPIALIAHMDTSPEALGQNVHPQIIEYYSGGDVALGNSGFTLSPEQFPFLDNLVGQTLITTDGTTLLGADDKAGIAEIMTVLEAVITGNLPHGPLWIAFTPDEEIGEGPDGFDLKNFGAKYAYTVDGSETDAVEYECFNAASAVVDIKGVSIHPGDAKNIMVNASDVAFRFHSLLPAGQRPEYTAGRQGFIHLTDMSGTVSSARLTYIVRDHDRALFEKKKQLMCSCADILNRYYGEGTVSLMLEDTYYNMSEIIEQHPLLIDLAYEAIRRAGLEPREIPIRGGTDGAQLSFRGLPCPNLGTGGYNYHGVYECITVQRMETMVQVLLQLIRLWAAESD